ncbi:unnamed protein product [Fusarium graminearum]|nr:unnamed protein product [Fusarium graminearum]
MDRRRTSFDHDDIRQAKRHKAIAYRSGAPCYDRYTVAWICALHIEMAAARVMLDAQHADLPRQGSDTNSYVLGTMHKHNIVIACLPADQYGTNNAASVLSNLKNTFPNIRIGLMVGIGGGVPTKADIRLGDIVVGIRVMQFDLGKTLSERFQRTAIPKIPDSSIRTVISNLRSQHELRSSRVSLILKDKMSEYPTYWLPDEPDRLFESTYNHESSEPTCDECDQLKLEARKIRGSTDPVIHYGAIASGNQVMKDATSRDEIARELDVICFEMEAAGLMDIMPCLPIRGICDYSDSHKAKEWQRYAAATAAAYAYEFLEVWGGDPQSIEADFPLPQNGNIAPSGRREILLESLDFEDIDSRKITIKAAYSKTCQWFLKHPDYLSWTNPKDILQHHGFFWIKGKPGAGKSTIMKFLYLRAKRKDRNSQSLTGSFFFNARGEELEKTVSGMYRSLVLQLLKGFPDLQCVLDDPELVPRGQAGCPSLNILKDLLRSAVLKLDQRSFTCYIDALDECDEQQVMDMVEYFEDLAEQCAEDGVRLQICFSSRHYPFVDIRVGLCLILEEQAGHTGDLETYIKSHLRVRDPSLLAELQEKMLEKASGVFMWVVLVVEVLNVENRRGRLSLKTRLEEVPSGLSELFKDLLRRDNTNLEELLLSILWILLSERPLKPEEYYHALWSGLSLEGLADVEPPTINVADANDCFGRCVVSSSKGLAEITKAKHPTVQFIHESVRDFLIKDKGLHELWPELGADWESSGHDRLKLCCQSYVKFVGTQELPLRRLDIDKSYPFLEYASQLVLHHADRASDVVCQEAFLDHFPTAIWINVVNIFEKFKIRRYTKNATLIYILADRRHSGLIRVLIEANPDNLDINRPVKKARYRYPLIAAMVKGGKGHAGIVRMLLDAGADIHSSNNYNIPLLCLAAGQTNEETLKVLLERGASVHQVDFFDRTPLHHAACQKGSLGIMKELFRHGADIHARDDSGATCLLTAAEHAKVEEVTLLIKHGADVNAQDQLGRTCLHKIAKRHRSLPSLDHLLQILAIYKVETNASDIFGDTPLHVLWLAHSDNLSPFLNQSNLDLNAQNHEGWTPLHRASNGGRADLVAMLIEHGADVNLTDNKDRTPLDYAWTEGVAQILTTKGGKRGFM